MINPFKWIWIRWWSMELAYHETQQLFYAKEEVEAGTWRRHHQTKAAQIRARIMDKLVGREV